MGGQELVFASQVHGDDILILKKDSSDKRPFPMTGDAIITDIPGKNLVIQTADCQAVLLYDTVKKVAANVHSGWRGSICNIIGKTVQAMKEIFGCHPGDIFAGIGPALGPCCAEFIHYEKEIPGIYWKYKNNSHHFDFRAISRDQLCSAGLKAENIHSTEMCTKCRTDLFFSYRGEGNTGRFAAVIGIK